MSLVRFECPLKGEKELLLERENLDSMLKSISTWSPAENVNIENEGAAGKNFWNFWNLAFQNGKKDRE